MTQPIQVILLTSTHIALTVSSNTAIAASHLFIIYRHDTMIAPLRTASASMTASIGGGSTALARNGPIPPNLSDLMLSASSCRGVLNISGVECSSSLQPQHTSYNQQCHFR